MASGGWSVIPRLERTDLPRPVCSASVDLGARCQI